MDITDIVPGKFRLMITVQLENKSVCVAEIKFENAKIKLNEIYFALWNKVYTLDKYHRFILVSLRSPLDSEIFVLNGEMETIKNALMNDVNDFSMYKQNGDKIWVKKCAPDNNGSCKRYTIIVQP